MGAQQYALLLKKLATGMVSVTGGLVSLLGFLIWYSIVSSTPDPALFARSAISSSNSVGQSDQTSVHEDIDRAPSSIPSLKIESDKLVKSGRPGVETMALGCLKDGMKFEVKSQSKQVRIKARLCDSVNLVLNESSMVNRANGFEATLFKIEDGTFTSDYISLAEGRNQILYNLQNEKGEKSVGEVTIELAAVK